MAKHRKTSSTRHGKRTRGKAPKNRGPSRRRRAAQPAVQPTPKPAAPEPAPEPEPAPTEALPTT